MQRNIRTYPLNMSMARVQFEEVDIMYVMMMQTKNIPTKHVNDKGSVGGRKRSGYHVMMMQTEHINIPPKHVNAKGSVRGRKRSGYHVMMMQTKNIPAKYVNARGSVGGRKRSGYHANTAYKYTF